MAVFRGFTWFPMSNVGIARWVDFWGHWIPVSDMGHLAPGLQGLNSHVGHGNLLAKHLGNAAGIPMLDMGNPPP